MKILTEQVLNKIPILSMYKPTFTHLYKVIISTLLLCTSCCIISAQNTVNNKTFTEHETNNISANTQGIFDNANIFEIDFSKIQRGDWCFPRKNGRVISHFGGKRNHKGTDIKTHAGDTIYAAFEGRVRFAKPCNGYGNVIVLRHDIGIETFYSHNKKNLVRIGDHVKAGQPIAIVGRTGRATTEHCHFEVRINGKPYNPMIFFDSTTRQLRSLKVTAYRSGKIETTNIVPEYDFAQEKSAGKIIKPKG